MVVPKTLLGLLDILVKMKNLSTLKIGNKIRVSAKHIVFVSEHSIRELLSGDTKGLKGPKTEAILLCENEIFEFAKQIYRPRYKWGKSFTKWKETPLKSQKGKLNYRQFNRDTFETTLKEHDELGYQSVSQLIGNIEETFCFDEYLKLSYFEDSCTGGGIIEHYEFKPIYIVALWIENLEDAPIKLKNYDGDLYFPNDGLEFRTKSWGLGEEVQRSLPSISLKRGESLLIPEMLLFGEINSSGTSKPFLSFHIDRESVLSFDTYDDPCKILTFGPALSIEKVNLEKIGLKIHAFDPSQILRLSKDYLIGSCPFIFGYDEGQYIFIKELFTNSDKEIIELSKHQYFVITELEDEVSYFYEIKLDSRVSRDSTYLFKGITLRKGESICIRCLDKEADELILSGFYQPKKNLQNAVPDDLHNKLKIIEEFLVSINNLALTNEPRSRVE